MRFRASQRRRLATVVLAGGLMLLATSSAWALASAPPLSLIGSATRSISLASCISAGTPGKSVAAALESEHCIETAEPGGARSAAGKIQAVAIGQLLLGVQNMTAAPVPVSLRYVREDGRMTELTECPKLTPVAGAVGPVPGQACVSGQTPLDATVKANSPAWFPLRFLLLSGEPPRALQGDISIKAGEQTIVVPVTTSIQETTDVQPESSTVHLSADSWHIPLLPNGRATTVTVIGPGVGAMLARQPLSPRRILFHDANGHAAELKLGPFQAEPAQATKAESRAGAGPVEPLRAGTKLELTNHPPPGTYSGKIGLSELEPSTPALDVQVVTHLPLWFAILCVLTGVVAATIIAPLALLRRRAAELTEALRGAVSRYQHVDGVLGERAVALWNLNDVAGVETVGLVHVADALAGQIQAERTDEDFNDDRLAMLDATARLSRWLRVAPAALRLSQVADGAELAAGEQLRESTATAHATRLLQQVLEREPADAAATDDLVARVLRQAKWHYAYREALNDAKAKAAPVVPKLETLDGELVEPGVMQRTDLHEDELYVSLEDLRAELKLKRSPDLPTLPGGLPQVNWAATPSLFTGWSTLDGASFGDLRARSERRYSAQGNWPSVAEWLWSGFFVLVSSVIYELTIYSNTWGSIKDILTALTAGFAGAVVLRAALPIFTSQRLRPAAKA